MIGLAGTLGAGANVPAAVDELYVGPEQGRRVLLRGSLVGAVVVAQELSGTQAATCTVGAAAVDLGGSEACNVLWMV
jgi:hypothetical protein